MKFDLMYLLNVMMLAICAISLGYMALRCLKGKFTYTYNRKSKERPQRIKALDYNIYLDIKDYVTYEKHQIWRYYFPA